MICHAVFFDAPHIMSEKLVVLNVTGRIAYILAMARLSAASAASSAAMFSKVLILASFPLVERC